MTRSLKDMTIKQIETFVGSYSRPDNSASCWRWRKSFSEYGYGTYNRTDSNTGVQVLKMAHRITYELFRGLIPDGLVLDHLCRNRWCVNPDHLEAVTQGENVRRGWTSRRLMGTI